MARLRFWTVALLALALTGNASQTGRTQVPAQYQLPAPAAPLTRVSVIEASASSSDCTCVIYALSDRGFDADFGKWIAETLKEVVEPRSWHGSCSLRYYAPKNILVVNNSSEVHTKIDNFLKEMKTKMPKEKPAHAKTTKNPPRDLVVPAAYRQVNLPPEPSAYPVPAPVKTPKHLFHFLIRYEGEGIIDDNVVKFMKVQSQAEKSEKKSENAAGPDTPPTVSIAPVNPVKRGYLPAPAEPISAPSKKKQEEKKDEQKKDEEKSEEKKDGDKKDETPAP